MIPQRLELSNFLSYRDQVSLDFQGIDLACISGANGAGKSSILDAITWALFGRSRSRSDDDLINRMAVVRDDAAEVRFTFILEGTTYRVLRSKRSGKAVVLELQLADPDGGWKTLSERKLRETQAQIEQLLRMNYDTFTNASFLLQGKADQFTTRTANQRKEILAELLGVTVWERYREAAAERRKGAEGQAAFIEARLSDIDEELGQKEEREQALAEAITRRKTLSEKLALQEQLLRQVRQTAAAVEQQKLMVKNLASSVERIKRSLQAAQASLEKREQEKAAQEHILAEKEVITAAYEAHQMAEAEVQAWQEKANQYNDLQRQMQPHKIALAESRSRLQQELDSLETQAAQVEGAREKQPALEKTIAAVAARLEALEAQLAALAAQQKTLQEAQGRLQQLQGQRDLAQRELHTLEAQEKRMRQSSAERADVAANEEEAAAQVAALAQELATNAAQQEQYLTAKAELDTLRGRQQPLRQEMDVLKERIQRLQEAPQDSACPTCGQPLTAEHRRDVLADLQEQGQQKGDQFRANKERIAVLDAQVAALESAFEQKTRLDRSLQTQQQRLARAEARLAEIIQAEEQWRSGGAQRLEALRAELADDTAVRAQSELVKSIQEQLAPLPALGRAQKELQDELSGSRAQARESARQIDAWQREGEQRLALVRETLLSEAYAQEARAALAALHEQAETLGYDAAAHTAAVTDREALSAAPARYQALKEAEAAIGALRDTISELQQRVAAQQDEMAEQSAQLETSQSQLETLVTGSGDLRQTEEAVNELREAEIAAERAVGIAQQKLNVLQDLQQQQKDLAAQRKDLAQRVRRLKFLEKSCGRQGVQALLIEHALPEIEERANQLIERLTGGSMRIYFDTQRQLKTRDALAETLDIRIEDKEGVRPYDNYSGGEQFRVNFAIRLALSQLLAHRAGARLQTLVIDEGFGSQDPQGRQRLVEAINSVRDEFACILVITHVAELRDAFPTRIEVEKTLDGSAIRII